MISNNILELLAFLPAIIYLGLRTSYSDIKHGRIKNKDILFALIYAIAAYSFLILLYKYNGFSIRMSYLLEVVSNGIMALATGFLLWHFKLWSAADAKLFFGYSLLIPLSIYEFGYIKYFPAFILLMNTFIPFGFYIVPKIIFFMPIREKKKQLHEFKWSFFIDMVLLFFVVTWAIKLISRYIGLNLNLFLSLLLIYFLTLASKKVFGKFFTYFLVLSALLRVLFDFSSIITTEFLKQFVIFSFFIFMVYVILLLGINIFKKEIKMEKIMPKMILADCIYFDKKAKKYKKIDASELQTVKNSKNKRLLELEGYAEGLTKSDLSKIRNLYSGGKIDFSSIKVQQTLPFAPFLLLGVILTLISRGNLAIFLRGFTVKFINILSKNVL